MKTLLVVLVCVLSLAGCAEFSSFKSTVHEYGGRYELEKLRLAEYQICTAARIGAVKEHYKDPKRLSAWKLLCNQVTDFSPVPGDSSLAGGP